ncbi:MAG: hypothetical protein IH948_10155, partial [Bacteroidetes bacterium]|nr:hypothetical protein [Bacteroidota bacterium]
DGIKFYKDTTIFDTYNDIPPLIGFDFVKAANGNKAILVNKAIVVHNGLGWTKYEHEDFWFIRALLEDPTGNFCAFSDLFMTFDDTGWIRQPLPAKLQYPHAAEVFLSDIWVLSGNHLGRYKTGSWPTITIDTLKYGWLNYMVPIGNKLYMASTDHIVVGQLH